MKFNWNLYKIGRYDAFYLGELVFPQERLDGKLEFSFCKGNMTGLVQCPSNDPPEELTMEFKYTPKPSSLVDVFVGIFFKGDVITERNCYSY